MKEIANRGDRCVDAFLAAVNASPRETLLSNEVPAECVISTTDDVVEWRIVPGNGAPWLPQLEASFPVRSPASFRSLGCSRSEINRRGIQKCDFRRNHALVLAW
jgi:hypothetical protein